MNTRGCGLCNGFPSKTKTHDKRTCVRNIPESGCQAVGHLNDFFKMTFFEDDFFDMTFCEKSCGNWFL